MPKTLTERLIDAGIESRRRAEVSKEEAWEYLHAVVDALLPEIQSIERRAAHEDTPSEDN